MAKLTERQVAFRLKRKINFIKSTIEKNKYLRDEKYYKNNVKLVAHFQSTTATYSYCYFCGEKGGAVNSIYNKRKGKLFDNKALVLNHFCSDCEKLLNDELANANAMTFHLFETPYKRTEWCR
jgi:hypothetical protein